MLRATTCRRGLTALAILTLTGHALAYDVFLDWSGADTQFQLAWDSAFGAAADDLTVAELDDIKASVKTSVEAAYAGFMTTFVTSAPAGTFQTIAFGSTTTSTGLFGIASRIDWRNSSKGDTAYVYLKNFGTGNGILSGFESRADNIAWIKNAVSGTTAHELGHELGLHHYDCFCYDDNTYAGGYNTFDEDQNNHIMATGSSGLTALDRRTKVRTFNTLEKIRLEYADEVSPDLGKSVGETGAAHSTFATAQELEGELLSVTQRHAVLVEEAYLAGTSEVDMYSFEALSGSMLTLNALSFLDLYGDRVDTYLRLFDKDFNELAFNDDISYSTSGLMESGTAYGIDSLILNYEAGYTGTYYASVSVAAGATNVSGYYDLLVVGAVPEPGSMTVLALGLGAWAARRRKRVG